MDMAVGGELGFVINLVEKWGMLRRRRRQDEGVGGGVKEELKSKTILLILLMIMSFSLRRSLLSKFLKLEQLDQDVAFPTDTTGVSIDGTGQVGTYFYTAPEIVQGWPKIDEKADMYSLGVVFFELWHSFGTAMERRVVLSDLKQKGELPPARGS
ncbi:eIF-2-alpha kinase GCN2 [Melia azedarach]|uniref:EIF-2-alpha kinase GCN2 n=1 Tax=Melia azedarach TaxID=155640 RepID=A0ACC1YI30_MELAZ|nr:eIF-2-alpha kinase GCN2 [Melia azedarach]